MGLRSLFDGRQQRVRRPSYALFDDRRTHCWRPSNNDPQPSKLWVLYDKGLYPTT